MHPVQESGHGRPAAEQVVLVTGFEPYGGSALNPSGQVAQLLDGERIALPGRPPASPLPPVRIAGRTLPVAFRGLRPRLAALLDEVRPQAVLCLGLAPGEPVIRLETVGLNLAQFEMPDNEGLQPSDAAVEEGGGAALFATLPLADIERRLLQAGIPARRSTTAGTYLCNATLYTALSLLHARRPRIACGFVHLPYLPEQAAALLLRSREERRTETLRSDGSAMNLATMSLETMVQAVRLAVEETLHAQRSPA